MDNIEIVYKTLKKHFGNSATLLKQDTKIVIRTKLYLEADTRIFTEEKDKYSSIEIMEKKKQEIVIHF